MLKGSVITYGSILMVLLAVAVWYMLNRTAFGRHVYATGDDPDAARLAGISTNRTLIAVYALAGLICAIAAWVLIGRIGGVSPQAGQTANLDSITAVVIGGTSLFGGRGSIVGTLIGALDRRRVPQRTGALRPRRAVAGVHRRRADHRRRHPRPMDQEGRRMSAALDLSKESAPLAARQPVLQARGLVKHYGRVVALDHADFDLMPNEILGVIGDNGAGKSTLIKVLAGAIIPDAGQVFMDGKAGAFPLADRGAHSRHRDGLSEPRAVAGTVDRRQSLPRPRAAEAGTARATSSACSTAPRCGARRASI